MTTQKIHIALCGVGRIGQVHYNLLQSNPQVHLSAIVDTDLERAQQWATTSTCKPYQSLTSLFSDPETPIQGVVICTPTHTHAGLIKEALFADKTVFCEKPISHSVEEVDELYKIARDRGLHLLCGFHRRFDPHFNKLREVLNSGKVGKLLKIRSTSRDNPENVTLEYLKISGGIVADCGSHDLDMIRYLSGEEPSSVYVVGTAYSSDVAAIHDHDQCDMLLYFPSGLIASVDISRNAVYGYDQRIEVLTSQGSIIAENQKPTTVIVGMVDGFLHEPSCWSFPQRYKEAYQLESQHFIDLVRGVEKTPKLLHWDVHQVTVILVAAQKSLREGRVVKIEEC